METHSHLVTEILGSSPSICTRREFKSCSPYKPQTITTHYKPLPLAYEKKTRGGTLEGSTTIESIYINIIGIYI